MSRTIYLAGPEVFHPDAAAIGHRKRALCREYGFDGKFPLDDEVGRQMPSAPGNKARAIYRANLAMIETADAVIANLTPFRGSSADPGTVFELGYAAGRGLLIFGYSNKAGTLLDKIRAGDLAACCDLTGGWRDGRGHTIENFGLADNLMIVCCLEAGGAPLVINQCDKDCRLTDLTGFRTCLNLARRAFAEAVASGSATAAAAAAAAAPATGDAPPSIVRPRPTNR
jgi:nucleoside 2-deoxyribosyltransferase